jgi:hypothetical protein
LQSIRVCCSCCFVGHLFLSKCVFCMNTHLYVLLDKSMCVCVNICFHYLIIFILLLPIFYFNLFSICVRLHENEPVWQVDNYKCWKTIKQTLMKHTQKKHLAHWDVIVIIFSNEGIVCEAIGFKHVFICVHTQSIVMRTCMVTM